MDTILSVSDDVLVLLELEDSLLVLLELEDSFDTGVPDVHASSYSRFIFNFYYPFNLQLSVPAF